MEYKSKKEILDRFYKSGFPFLQKFEKRRINDIKKLIIVEFICIAIAAAYFFGFGGIYNFCAERDYAGLFLGSHILILCIILFIIMYPFSVYSEFKKKIKKDLMPEVVRYFKHLKYSTNSTISNDELIKSTLFSRFSRNYADDNFNGKYNGINFRISETELVVQGQKYYSTSFKGVIVDFDSNKTIKSKTIVTTAGDTATKNRLPVLLFLFLFIPVFTLIWAFKDYFFTDARIIKDLFLPMLTTMLIFIMPTILWMLHINKNLTQKVNTNRKEIKLEDTKFGRQFRVYSGDEVEARYLVTPAFMERFLNLTTAFGTNKAKCAFFDNKIMFAISTRKNLFEFGSLFKSLNNPQNIGFFNELLSILDMIDYFKIDEKTGL